MFFASPPTLFENMLFQAKELNPVMDDVEETFLTIIWFILEKICLQKNLMLDF